MTGFHTSKSPSGAKRLHRCAGALPFIESLPDDMRSTSNKASRLGTAAHMLLETSLREQKAPCEYEGRLLQIVVDPETGNEVDCVMLKPRAKMPKEPEAVQRTFLVDEFMIADVDRAYYYVADRCEEEGVPMSSLQLETRTNPCPERDDTSGTADVTLDAWPSILEVIDYKNGRVTVEHEDNEQLLSYLAGRAHDTGWSHDAYRITVVQPNGRHDEGKIRSFDISKEDLRAFVERHRAAAELCDKAADDLVACEMNPLSEMPDRVPGTWADVYLSAGPHCDYCDARLVCPEAKAYAKRQAKADFDDRPPEAKKSRLLVRASDEARKILEWAPYLEAHIRAARRFLDNEASRGRMPEGLKYIRGKSHRTWILGEDGQPIPDDELVELLIEAGYIGPSKRDKLIRPALVTGPQAERLVHPKLRKQFSKEFMYVPEGKLILVPESAPGEAVIVKPGDDFPEDEDEEY